ncbi:MAG: putative two-component system sensor kinase [Verrucomicrobiales bacterium]|nr:putative two-component system sensor kinase [Verrucomicrobiales bacterium]
MSASQQCRLLILALCVALSVVPQLQAAVVRETESYISQRWQSEHGLPTHAVRSAAQSADNYLWIGTEAGLARFDGARFVTITTTGLSNQMITAIHQTQSGAIFIGTDSGTVTHILRGAIRPFPIPKVIGEDAITTLFESRDGSLWIGTGSKGLFKHQNGAFTNFTTNDGLVHNSIRAICEDTKGNLWIATASGLSRYAEGKFTTYTSKQGLLHNSTRALCLDRSGNLWVGSHYGLSRFKDGKFRNFTQKDGLSDNIVSSVFEDHEGQLWIGTLNGLTRRSEEKFIIETATDGGSFDRVYGISEDREQNLWVCTRDGLIRMKRRVLTTLTMQNGLSHNSVSSIAEDKAGAVWIGLWGGGVNKVSGNEIQKFSRTERLSSDLVLTLLPSRAGEMWFGMDYDGGLNRMSNERIDHLRSKEGFVDHSIRALFEDSKGVLWVGTRSGLAAYQNSEFTRYTVANGLPSNSIECFYEDRQGRLWCGTDGGMAIGEKGTFKSYGVQNGLSHRFVSVIFEDKEGSVWVGTMGGLNRFHNGTFSTFTTTNGLFHDQIHGIQEDEFGRLWLTSSRGIFCIHKKNLADFEAGLEKTISCTVFGKADGMLSTECKGTGSTALCKTQDGKLWVPTSRGVVVVDPRRETFNQEPPQLHLEEVLVDGHEVDSTQPVRLVANKNEMVFRFTSPSFDAPEKMAFKYKLDGWDSDWIDATKREAHYGRLPAGEYQFRVIACNSDGLWNQKGITFNVSLTPAFYKSWWFMSALALLASGLVVGTVRYVSVHKIKSQLRRTEEEHAVERERTRIAQDMHDELGARLTEILLLSELASKKNATDTPAHLTKMNSAVHDVVRNLDAIVWAVNPENDSLEKLVGYIHEYAQAYLETASIRSRFEFPDKVVDIQLPSDVRHNFFSVVKECLNNVVKHSGATAATMQLRSGDGILFFSLEDDGKGFSPTEAAHAGNGLKNMQKRMQAVGGQFELQSAAGKGAKISIQFPIKTPKPEQT